MKKLNIKSLFVNHAEKLGLGLCVLVVAIALMKTSWSRHSQRPEKLLEDIKRVRDGITAKTNVWADQSTYVVVDYSDKARQIFAPIPSTRYGFSTPLFHPLAPKVEARREPIYEPVFELLAKASLTSLSMMKELDSTMSPTDPNSTESAAMEAESEFGSRTTRTSTGPLRPGQAFGVGGDEPERPRGPNRPTVPALGGNMRGKGRHGDEDDEPSMGGVGPGRSIGSTQNVASRGVRVIAVRGVFPLKRQIENYRKALHISEPEAAGLVEIMDFILERQVAQAGPDPWKDSEWKTVKIEKALETLKESSGIEIMDPVPLSMKDSAITMDLPMRMNGSWLDSATHPKIKSEELKADEIAKQAELLDSLEESVGDTTMNDPKRAKKRGLSSVQNDVRSMVGIARAQPGGIRRGPMADDDDGPRGMGGRGGARRGGNMTQGTAQGGDDYERLIAGSNYLLFRYFDFDVQSGYAYRYRVRLSLRNPNYDSTPEERAGADPAIANGEERETPWSAISNAEVVPTSINYFLKDVDRDPYRDDKVRPNNAKPVAQLAMFDWDTQLGTMISDVLNTYAIGQFISELKKETLVLDLVESTLQKKKHQFTTLDVLVDVEQDIDLVPDQHPDLKLRAEKSKSVARVGIVEEALVMTELGELKLLDPYSELTEEEKWKKRVADERRDFKVTSEAAANTKRNGGLFDDEQPRGSAAGAAAGRRGPNGVGGDEAQQRIQQRRKSRMGRGGDRSDR
ncbi:hypothetical protein [Schlesneria paludicola]|uniref:hypothetical protein n=1 Tax=Schlesneria paludicola TaxID=360056 RepID=UPI00029A667E|nr:hypothetical protein [Schlesneria paludicola]